jgi:Conserved TM helix
MSTGALPLAIDWQGGLSNAFSSIATFVPKLLIFLVILLVGWIIAKALSKLVGVLLDKVGFERAISRAGAGETLDRAGFHPAVLITKLVYYFILLITLQLALTVWGPSNPVSNILDKIIAWLPRAFVAIIIIVIAVAIANAVKDLMRASLGGLSYAPLLTNIVGAFIIALGVIAAVNQIGVAVSVTEPVLIAVLATVAGILIVGVGGGLIGPMRNRWEGWLDDLQSETRRARATHGTGDSTSTEYESSYHPRHESPYASSGDDATTGGATSYRASTAEPGYTGERNIGDPDGEEPPPTRTF